MLGVYSVSLDGQRSSLRVRGLDNLNPDGILRGVMTCYRRKGWELSNADLPYYRYQAPPIADMPPCYDDITPQKNYKIGFCTIL